MRRWLVAFALCIVPAALSAQSFTAYQTDDMRSPELRGGAWVADWDRDYPLRHEWAFGFQNTGPGGWFDTVSVRVQLLEGANLGVSVLRGPTRQQAELLGTWAVRSTDMFQFDDPRYVANFRADVAIDRPIALVTGEVYWISLFADRSELNALGFGAGHWVWSGGTAGVTPFAAESRDRGLTWEQTTRTAGSYAVTARIPEPAAIVLMFIGTAGVLHRRRLSAVRREQ